ncbi:MAG: hypothetical protein IJ680_05045 [Paludibacteraceae bacterium]|nr:hypothetical protein [Paludibacteraceae bacterium]
MSPLEQTIRQDLHAYLLQSHKADEHLPETYDIEEKWDEISRSYLPDGVREFADYPIASLGWMMYIGMAVARFWDLDWERHAHIDNLYTHLRDQRGYDQMDEYIIEKVLLLEPTDRQQIEHLIGECASRTYSQLRRQHIEPGTQEALQAYIDCLHQLYLFGAYIQLYQMNYHMTRIDGKDI